MGVAVFKAQSPMIRHLVDKKIPLARPGAAQHSIGGNRNIFLRINLISK